MTSKPVKNRITNTIKKLEMLPKGWQMPVFSFLIGRMVKLAGTTGCRVTEINVNRCVVELANKKKVQNHIGSVHAAGIALLAESATGYLTSLSVPDSHIQVIRTLKVTYLKRASGDMKAVASLNDEQVAFIQQTDKGELEIPVVITDETGTETAEASMIWAWTPKKKKS